MIKHIVLWKLKNRSDAQELKTALETLPAKISQIKAFEVGVGEVSNEAMADLSLVSAFASEQDLKAYAEHPEHQKVVALIRDKVSERRVIDYSSDA